MGVNRIKRFQHYSKWVSVFLASVLVLSILPTLASTWFDKTLLYDLAEYWESPIPGLLVIPVIWVITDESNLLLSLTGSTLLGKAVKKS